MGFINLDFVWDLGIRNILILLGVFSFTNGFILLPASQVILIMGGLVVGIYHFNFFLVFGILVISNFLGNFLLYYISYIWGEKGVRRFLPIRRKSLDDDIMAMNYLFKKYGTHIIFFGRNLPVLHSLVSIPSGIAKVPKRKFSFYTFLGICTWSLFFMGVGIIFGSNYEYFLEKFQFFGVILTSFVIIGFWYFFKYYWGNILTCAREEL